MPSADAVDTCELADLFQSWVERERHWRGELNQRKIPMIRVQQVIVFMGNNRGRNREDCALASKLPFRSNDPCVVYRNCSVPSLWQGPEFDGFHRKGRRNLDFYQDHIARKRPAVRQHFQSAQRCALGAIDDTGAAMIPSPSVKPGTFAIVRWKPGATNSVNSQLFTRRRVPFDPAHR